jgi:uncharacterized protein
MSLARFARIHPERPISIFRQTRVHSQTSVCRQCLRNFSSSKRHLDELKPQARLQADLKAALRAKDKPRLTVLRALLAELTNASKTSKPVETDAQLLSLIRKKMSAAEVAIKDAQAAGRQDLADKEGEEVKILEDNSESLGGGIASPEQILEDVKATIEELRNEAKEDKLAMGDVLKRLLGPGGALEGKADGKQVAATVKKLMS